ncbi:(E)-4-hydroxy-3-methylbut-2-enyl-diphosphate synthase [bacterium]|nr:(E)-4-hydroxy-3-methylbut-2-enyl-diphosphate synthase [bacterium]
MQKYCENTFSWQRRATREVKVGDVGVGGKNPVRVQSMTISDTMDTLKTVNEAVELYQAGCEIVRITAPSVHEAENLKNIRYEIQKRGYKIPLVADIHFKPEAAMIAANYVDKVRINPGNFADKKRFAVLDYTDFEYQAELERIEKRFSPLVKRCKTNGISMRIGTNHGSLSDRIMNRFGDTPEGMVESALEFVKICEACNYKDLIISMKASNPQVMIQAYRLLAAKMYELKMDYPFHLGVTEAGDGEDGRIKSAVGIGALLEDGIGDTIRVSLTEDSIHEIPVAYALVEKYNNFNEKPVQNQFLELVETRNPFVYKKRETLEIKNGDFYFGGKNHPTVELQLFEEIENLPKLIETCKKTKFPPEFFRLFVAENQKGNFKNFFEQNKNFACFTLESESSEVFNELGKFATKLAFLVGNETSEENLLSVLPFSKSKALEFCFKVDSKTDFSKLVPKLETLLSFNLPNLTFSFKTAPQVSSVHFYRFLSAFLDQKKCKNPITLVCNTFGEEEEQLLRSSVELGSLLCDGIGDSVLVVGSGNTERILSISYGILQATRTRISRTDFISCPSCGRTLFNLQTVTEKIKERTNHLKGVKIAIMGCVVNGPGEMADADFGYVGSGPGKVNLFVGKECVKTSIGEEKALDELVKLIKEHGKWVEDGF